LNLLPFPPRIGGTIPHYNLLPFPPRIGGTIEFFVGKNLQDHQLTSAQMKLTRVQTLKTIAMATGIFTGCVLGMFPLIWPKDWRLYGGRSGSESGPPKDEDEAEFNLERLNSNN
jgi:hypothetical protein